MEDVNIPNDAKAMSGHADQASKTTSVVPTPDKTPKDAAPPPVSKTFLQTLFSWRMVMALHMHVQFVVFTMIRQDIPLALVCMIGDEVPENSTALTEPQEVTTPTGYGNGTSFSPSAISELQEEPRRLGEFSTWSSSTQGLLLSSTSILCFVMPLLTEAVSRRVGTKRLLLWSMVISGLLTLSQPVAARYSPYLMAGVRIAIGFCSGVNIPILNEVFSWWAPGTEVVTLVSFAFSGLNVGSIGASLTGGYLCSVPLDNGWPLIFYVNGSLCLLWSLAWQITGSVKPEDHPFISEDERRYIVSTRRQAVNTTQKRVSPPYKKIFCSLPVWSAVVMNSVHNYVMMALVSFAPKYLHSMLGYTTQQVGLISSVGYAVRFLGVIVWGQVSNLLLRTTRLKTTAVRKLVQCSGYYLATGCVVAVALLHQRIPSTVLLNAVLVLVSCSLTSVSIVPLDIAPRFANFVSGILTTAGFLSNMPAPLVVSAMIQHGSREEWRNVFLTTGALCVAGATFFLFTASSALQSWAVSPDIARDEEVEVTSDVPSDATTMKPIFTIAQSAPTSPTSHQPSPNNEEPCL